MYDAIIVGSGPAGYTAGIYLSRAGLKNRLITGYSEGGQLTTTTLVENYPGFENGIDGNTLVQTMRRQAEQFGTEMTFGFVQKIWRFVSDFGYIPHFGVVQQRARQV